MTDPVRADAVFAGETVAASAEQTAPAKPRRKRRRYLYYSAWFLIVYLFTAYALLPWLWKHYEHHPALENAPKITTTAQGIPGDPLNVSFVGSEEEVVSAFLAAGWSPADPITLKSSVRIASSVVLRRKYEDAPVSNLFVFGRKQDLAFEKAAGKSASRRNHIRLWKAEGYDFKGRTLWLAAATFDRSVGLSHRTGQVTHHIAANVDAERDEVVADLVKARRVTEVFQATGVGATLNGRNGGGDWYYTDGELSIAVLTDKSTADGSTTLPNPPVVQLKEQLWSLLKPVLQQADSDDEPEPADEPVDQPQAE